MYKVIDPDAKQVHPEWEEINKDAVTGNLKEKEIKQFMIGSSIIGICESFRNKKQEDDKITITGGILEGVRDDFMRELMGLVNITKSRQGFALKKITEQVQKVITQESKDKKSIGD